MTNAEILYMRQVLVDHKDDNLLPTTTLQLESLTRFMVALGYRPVDNGQNFKLKDKSLPYPLHIGWRSAVRLHNYGVFIRSYGEWVVAEPMRLYNRNSAEMVSEFAWKQKVVARVSLQWSKKRKMWVTTGKRVKFVNPEEPCKRDVLT